MPLELHMPPKQEPKSPDVSAAKTEISVPDVGMLYAMQVANHLSNRDNRELGEQYLQRLTAHRAREAKKATL